MEKMTNKYHLMAGLCILIGLAAFGYYLTAGAAQAQIQKPKGPIIRGRVISSYGPVENARVRIAGSEKYTLTDREGRYEIAHSYPPGQPLMVTAGKEGWFNNGQLADRSGRIADISLNPIYLDDRPDYRFISPVTCSRCHVNLTRYYDQSKMAHTTSNPKVLDMYYGTDALLRKGMGPGYRIDNPGNQGNCTQCHAPSVAGAIPWSQDLNDVLRSPRTEWDGISCDYCHKVRKVIKDKNKASGRAAVLERQSPIRGNSILVFGPYDDVTAPPMAASYNPVFDKGQFCSLCHSHFKKLASGQTWDSTKVYTTAEWEGFGLEGNNYLPIQTTYQEWKQWQDQLPPDDANKGKKCQDCHLSWRKEMLPYDNYVVDGNARNMWGTYRSPKDIRPHHFDGGTETQLKTALAMELEGEISENTLLLSVFITNTNGGHWVPTGETMRSVMLLLNVTDSNGKPLEMLNGSRLPKKSVAFKFEFAIADPEDEPTAEARLIYRPVIRPLATIKNWDAKDILITSTVW